MKVTQIRPVSAHPTVLPTGYLVNPRRPHQPAATTAQRVTVQHSIGGHVDLLARRNMTENGLLTRAAILVAELHGGEQPSDVQVLELAACFQLILEQRVVADA